MKSSKQHQQTGLQHCLFSSSGKHFLTISSDNRLRLWDVVTQKEKRCYVEKQHLSHSYTCFSWGQDVKSKGVDDLGVCAVGTSDGTVVVWDLMRGVVIRSLGTAGASPVPSSVQFSPDLTSVFVSSAAGADIIQYSLATGEILQTLKGLKKGTLRLAVSSLSNVLAAGSGYIKIYDQNGSGKKEKLDASFSSSGVSIMSFSECGRFLACAGAAAREVVVFSRSSSESEDDDERVWRETPLCVCPVSGTVRHLALKVADAGSEGNKSKSGKQKDKKKDEHFFLDILCVLNEQQQDGISGGGCLIRVEGDVRTLQPVRDKNGGEKEVSISQVPFTGYGSEESATRWLSGSFSKTADTVIIASGPLSSPRFVTVPYLDSSSSDKPLLSSVVIPAARRPRESEVAGESSAGSTVQASEEVSVLGPHENGGTKRPHILDDQELSSEKRQRSKDTIQDKLTIEERLNSVSSALVKFENMSSFGSTTDASQTPTTDSLVALVEQALKANDDGLLEQCLDCSEEDVVAETSRRLPTRLVVPLLRKVVAKFEKKPTRGVLLTRWIHGLLRFHMSYLLSVPDLSQQLAALSQMLEQRLATYSKLASLAGRLDLLISQISSSSSSSTSAFNQQQEFVKTPHQIYYED